MTQRVGGVGEGEQRCIDKAPVDLTRVFEERGDEEVKFTAVGLSIYSGLHDG
jgi:hypothetical protein